VRQRLKKVGSRALRRLLQAAIPFPHGELQRVSELRQMRDLRFELGHFLVSKFCDPPARCASGVSHSQNLCEFPQGETGSKSITNEEDPLGGFGRIYPVAALGARRFFENAQAFVVPQSVRAYSGCATEGSGS